MLVYDCLKAPHTEQFEIHSCCGSIDGNIDKDSKDGNHDGGLPITPRHLIADGGGGYAASCQPLPKLRRCLRAGVSDAAEEGMTQMVWPDHAPFKQEENVHIPIFQAKERIVQNPVDGQEGHVDQRGMKASWVRLVSAELARSRLAHLRGINAARLAFVQW